MTFEHVTPWFDVKNRQTTVNFCCISTCDVSRAREAVWHECRLSLQDCRAWEKQIREQAVFSDGFESSERLERETGIEPATTGLGSRCSTIELLPPRTTGQTIIP